MQLPSCLSSLNEAVHSTIFTARACARHRAYIARAMPRKPLALAIETVDDDDADADDAAAASSTPGAYSLSETMTFAQDGIILKGMQGMRLDGSPTSNITLADLEKQRVLGSGATSRVHLVKHRKTGELLALKELMAMADADTRRMAVNELRLASSAHAEHLVRFVDAFFDDGKISILMEFADGGSLDDVIKASGGGVPAAPLGMITCQMLHGLQYLHKERHQVHRDLKPANCMLTRGGHVKLSDFGISKQLESTDAFAVTQCGTTQYMAPERLQGDDYSYVADCWSVGVCVLEALHGKMPYPAAKSFIDQVVMITQGAAPQPPPDAGLAVKEFTDLCLKKAAAERASVRTLLQGAWMRQHAAARPKDLAAYLESILA